MHATTHPALNARRFWSHVAVLAVLSAAALPASAQFIAYNVAAPSSANQFINNPLGMDFDVNAPIEITRLGVFDSDQNGLTFAHTVRVYNRQTQISIASLIIPAGTSAQLIGGSRFLDLLTPLSLPTGFQGSIVAEGNTTDGNGNSIGLSTLNTGGGLISFVGLGRVSDNGPGTFPTRLDGGPANRYLSGTFVFRAPGAVTAAPEPGTVALVAMGLMGTAGMVIRRKKA